MIHAYVVTEGQNDIAILKQLLPQEITDQVLFVAGGSKYETQAMASSLLAAKQIPVAIVMDADTEDELAVQERLEFVRGLLRQPASGVPFEVIIAVPEIEAIFFRDRDTLEEITNRKLTDAEWELAEHRPKEILSRVIGTNSASLQGFLGNLSDDAITALRQHPLIQELNEFLRSTIAEKN